MSKLGDQKCELILALDVPTDKDALAVLDVVGDRLKW